MRQRANGPSRRQLERARGWAGLMLVLGCGSRSGLELARGSTGTDGGGPSGGGTVTSGGQAGSGGQTAGGGQAGAGGFGQALPILHAPDVRSEPPTFCTADGWCGSNADFVAISGTSPFDIWIIARDTGDIDDSPLTLDPSEHTAFLHWTGLRWDVWTLDGALAQPGLRPRALWAASDSDVWAIGDSGALLHFDGYAWSARSTPIGIAWTDVSGSGPNDVWAVGNFGAVGHFNGADWEENYSNSAPALTSVWAEPGARWFVDAGDLVHATGTNESVYTNAYQLTDIWAPNDVEAFAVGPHATVASFDGEQWEVKDDAGTTVAYLAVWGHSRTDVWAVGTAGETVHYDGDAWVRPIPLTGANLNAVWGVDGYTWVVGDRGTFLELKDGSWQSSQPTSRELSVIWGAAPDDVWAAGADFVHWNGQVWERVPDPADPEISALWGSGVSDVWAVGPQGTILRWDGLSWANMASPTMADINGVWGGAADDVWVVTEAGEGWHFDGVSWQLEVSGPGPWTAVWGDDAGQVVFVGLTSVLRRVDGPPVPVANPNEPATYTLAFGNGEHIWLGGMVPWGAYKAGGAYPELIRSDGLLGFTYDLEPTGPYGLNYNPIQAGWGFARDDVWVALPFVEHWEGMSWSVSSVGGSESVRALFGTTTDVWALTDTSGIIRRSR